MQLETERLVLRLPRLEDAAPLAEAWSDPEVMRFIGDGSTGDIEAARRAIERFLSRWTTDGLGHFTVERREDGCVVGRVGFLVWNPDAWEVGTRAEFGDRSEVELGWTLAREHWGHGFATEAAAACRDAAFGELGLARLISLIQSGNDRSIRVAEKLGERYERDVVVAGGQTARLYTLDR